MENQTNNSQAKKVVTVTEIRNLLHTGVDREQIRLKYGMKKAEFKRLMSNPKLKGVKVRRAEKRDSFELVDDTVETTTDSQEQTSQEVTQEVSDVQDITANETATETATESVETSVGQNEDAYL